MPATDRTLQEVVIVSTVRTPICAFRSSFAQISVRDLGAAVVSEAINRAGMNADDIEETIGGCVLTAGNGQNIARQVSIAAGIPVTSPAITINKICSSGLKATMLAAEAISIGDRDVVVSCGMENMSRAPYYLQRGDTPYGGMPLIDSIVKDGLTDGLLDKQMGECAEKTARDYGISRGDQDDYAIESYRRAAQAWQTNVYSSEVTEMRVKSNGSGGRGDGASVVVVEDEEYKRLNESKLRTLKPVFVPGGTITAGNASSVDDGACALLLTSAAKARSLQLRPLATILAYDEASTDPVDFSIAPSLAVPKVLNRANLTKEDVDLWEINEAFSVTALANMKILNLDHSRVNVHGGAVALGHPIGMSGARILCHLTHVLSKGQKGMATVCNGGGEATAMLIEKL